MFVRLASSSSVREGVTRLNIGFGLGMPSRPSAAQMQQWMSTLDATIPQLARDFESLWISDHFFWGDTPTMEAWTTLSFMAARWPNFKLGTMVLAQSYRNPALLAKMAATLQVLTEGRLILGIGAGIWTPENSLVGTPEQVVEQMQSFVAAGASYFMLILPQLPDPDVIGMLLEDVLPNVRATTGER